MDTAPRLRSKDVWKLVESLLCTHVACNQPCLARRTQSAALSKPLQQLRLEILYNLELCCTQDVSARTLAGLC